MLFVWEICPESPVLDRQPTAWHAPISCSRTGVVLISYLQILYFITGRLMVGISSQALLASFKKFFTPLVIQVLVDPLKPA
jgi:hypothetical protein